MWPACTAETRGRFGPDALFTRAPRRAETRAALRRSDGLTFPSAMPIRSASAEWRGALRDGSGDIETESGAVESAYSFDSRFGDGADAKTTNPEELLGAAHAACFTMAVSNELASAGHPPERATTTAKVHIDQIEGGFEIPAIELTLEASVPGMSDDEFQKIATHAKENCPLSKVLKAADISLDARLV